MKLKLVVASMSVLGLLSCPAYAAHTTKHKKHHHKVTHHVVTHDYKDMGALPVQAPIVNDWYNRITLDGVINFDTVWGNRAMGYMGENTQRVSLNNAQININANVNDWTKAFVAVAFDSTSGALTATPTVLSPVPTNPLATTHRPKPGRYENIKGSVNGANFEQAFITVGNMDEMPVYVKVGKQFLPFGKYNPHEIVRSMTNVMSETLYTSALVGFETKMGLAGSLYAFDNPLKRMASTTSFNSHTKTNYGAALSFAMPSDALGFDVGAGYMYDFTGVQDIGYAVSLYNGSFYNNSIPTYSSRVSGGSLYGDVNSGPFSLALRYVSALQSFAAADLATKATLPAGTAGAKPWAIDITGMYKFNCWDKNQNVYLGYQGSQNAVNLYLPKNRVLAGYDVEMWKRLNVGLAFNHDVDYSTGNGGTGNSSNQLALRVGVAFG